MNIPQMKPIVWFYLYVKFLIFFIIIIIFNYFMIMNFILVSYNNKNISNLIDFEWLW